jgi:hypothetical protein
LSGLGDKSENVENLIEVARKCINDHRTSANIGISVSFLLVLRFGGRDKIKVVVGLSFLTAFNIYLHSAGASPVISPVEIAGIESLEKKDMKVYSHALGMPLDDRPSSCGKARSVLIGALKSIMGANDSQKLPFTVHSFNDLCGLHEDNGLSPGIANIYFTHEEVFVSREFLKMMHDLMNKFDAFAFLVDCVSVVRIFISERHIRGKIFYSKHVNGMPWIFEVLSLDKTVILRIPGKSLWYYTFDTGMESFEETTLEKIVVKDYRLNMEINVNFVRTGSSVLLEGWLIYNAISFMKDKFCFFRSLRCFGVCYAEIFKSLLLTLSDWKIRDILKIGEICGTDAIAVLNSINDRLQKRIYLGSSTCIIFRGHSPKLDTNCGCFEKCCLYSTEAEFLPTTFTEIDLILFDNKRGNVGYGSLNYRMLKTKATYRTSDNLLIHSFP